MSHPAGVAGGGAVPQAGYYQPQQQPYGGAYSAGAYPGAAGPAYPGAGYAGGGGGGGGEAAPYFQPQMHPQREVGGGFVLEGAGGGGALPPGWAAHHTSDGRPYWYNAATASTMWERPT